MMDPPIVRQIRLTSRPEILAAIDYLMGGSWVFRGHNNADWTLQTSLEREFPDNGSIIESEIYWHFVRLAPRWLASHVVPVSEQDAAAWLGLIQHYGGPTRLLDVTRSPYVALYFAFEAAGGNDRALWAIDRVWCMDECAQIMARNEGISLDQAASRTRDAQAQLTHSLVHGTPHPDDRFASFKPFTGVFPLDPWKPDARQIAQQALFLCAANAASTFMENMSGLRFGTSNDVVLRFEIPASLREEVIEQLWMMNVTAATLFPDLGGLARSLRTYPVRRTRSASAAPWDAKP